MQHAAPAGAITRRAWLRLAAAACVLMLAGCSHTKHRDDAPEPAPAPAPEPRKVGGLEAHLSPIGPHNSAQGSVRFTARTGGVTMLVSLSGLAPGQYRVMVHENGNCTSPNGFSAGPPWTGATGVQMLDRVPLVTTNSEGNGTLTLRLNGVTVGEGPNGLVGRSVILHDGYTGPLTTVPDARNQRLACGVIGPAEALF
jgi:Cu-Zn family superoxide dismutase